MTDALSNEDVPILPCIHCGSHPIASLVVGGTRRDMRITGTIYTCMGEDCERKGEECQGDAAARASWNSKQAST